MGQGGPMGPSGAPRPDPSDSGKGKKEKGGKDKKTKKPGTARQQARRNGLIATMLAVLAGVGALAVLRKPEPPKTYVAVAKVLLRAGEALPADQIGLKTSIIVKLVPALYVEQGALAASSEARVWELLIGVDRTSGGQDWQIAGRRPKYPILAGQQIHPDPVFSDTIDLARPLGDDERLVTVSLDVNKALLGTLRSGDKIDIYTYVANTVSEDSSTTRPDPAAILETDSLRVNMLVEQAEIVVARNALAIEDKTKPDTVPNVYILRVATKDAVTLLSVDGVGRKMYALYRGEAITVPLDPTGATTTTTAPQS